jgi:microcystin-dependent protein
MAGTRIPGGGAPQRGTDAYSSQQQFYQLRVELDRLRAQIGSGVAVPVGGVFMFAGAALPTGMLVCDGSAVNRADYPLLWQTLGTTWGAGDGTLTFNLPDLRGRVPVGTGQGAGLTARTLAGTGGVESVTLTAAQSGLPAHTHNPLSGTGFIGSGSTLSTTAGTQAAVLSTTGSVTGGAKDATANHENMPPFAAVQYLIRAA